MAGRIVVLPDGRRVRLRELAPRDEAALAAVYDALDGHDQRLRFSRGALSRDEVRALAAAELARARYGVIAFGAGAGAGAGAVAVAAGSCVPGGSGGAEVAVAVVAGYQRARLGRTLLAELLAGAARAGEPVVRAVIRRDNASALALARSQGCLVVERLGQDITLELATDGTVPGWPAGRGVRGVRVLVEARGWPERPDVAALRARGAEVRQCPGPDDHRGRGCPLLEDGRCAAAEGADVILHALPPGDVSCARVRTAHQAKWPGRLG